MQVQNGSIPWVVSCHTGYTHGCMLSHQVAASDALGMVRERVSNLLGNRWALWGGGGQCHTYTHTRTIHMCINQVTAPITLFSLYTNTSTHLVHTPTHLVKTWRAQHKTMLSNLQSCYFVASGDIWVSHLRILSIACSSPHHPTHKANT